MNQRTDTKAETVTVTLVRSPIGFNDDQAAVVRGLGLRRIRHSVTLKDTPAIRGMIHKVRHLVDVSDADSNVRPR
jgi:large subunit ribosomal protein L30